MPQIPINQKPFTNVDSVSNKVSLEKYIDFEKDDYMSNRFRPGLGGDTNNYFADLGTGVKIDGIFELVNQDFIAVFSNGKLFKVASDATVTEITGVTINAGTPVSFADFGSVGFFCNNSKIIKWTYANATCAFIADGDAPTDATFVGFLDTYLLALRADSARIEFSDVGDPDNWLGEFVTAESRPDNASAMLSNFGELFVPGTQTIQRFIDSGDPTAPFTPMPGAVEERGTISPYSVTQIDNSYFFLDSERRVIRMSGNQPTVISNDFDSKFQALSTISDAIGYHFNAEGSTKYVLYFPTDGVTYVYDYKLQYWSEWSYFNFTTWVRDNYLGRCGRYITGWNKYIVGSGETDRLYIASRTYVEDEGSDIIAEMWTGRVDHGTSQRKYPKKITFGLKRGQKTYGASPQPKIFWSKRDDGASQWGTEKEIDINITGDSMSYVHKRRLGYYRDRQYRIKMQAGSTVLVSMEEFF